MLTPNGVQELLGVREGGGGGLAVGARVPRGGQWVPQHIYHKMIPMTR